MGKRIKWSKLDNAAKIFPSTSGKKDTKVFRFSCELLEPIEAPLLQKALEETMMQFPSFQCIMRRGLFWYYLEETDLTPVARQEYKPPCSPLYHKNKKTLLFEVTYYRNRIHFEVYHSLTDGTGAMAFLRTLVYQYIVIRYSSDFKNPVPFTEYDASISQKEDDSFQRYYTKEKYIPKKEKKVKGVRLRGLRHLENRIRVTEGVLPVKEVLKEAHAHNATLSIFITALFICAIGKELSMLNRKKPVVVAVPVNLRNYFPSESVRNFFSVFTVSYDFSKRDGSLEDIIEKVKEDFEIGLKEENLKVRLNKLASFEHNILARMIPLFLKDFVLKAANKLTDSAITASVSNIGIVKMPKEIKAYIRLFSIFISTTKVQICFCSYENNIVISFTSPFLNMEIQKNFFRLLSEKGISAEITVNPIDEE